MILEMIGICLTNADLTIKIRTVLNMGGFHDRKTVKAARYDSHVFERDG